MDGCPLSQADFDTLCEVIRYVARTSRLTPADADDFTQTVHLKLLERNFAPITQFSGRSSLRTFLTVVVKRLLLDWRNAKYGKWRPCAAARRLGPDGVSLDRLIARDGHAPDEAIAIMENRHHGRCPAAVRALARRLPHRTRVEMLNVADVQHLGAYSFVDPIESAHAAAIHRRTMSAMRRACKRLEAEDRLILKLRFCDNMPITAIAAHLSTPARPMFRRMQRILKTIRKDMTANGTTRRMSAASTRPTAARVHSQRSLEMMMP